MHLLFFFAECRDLLRRLLEPNPYIRLHLQDVMDHPWITMKGELPLKPYFSPVIDQDIIDKVHLDPFWYRNRSKYNNCQIIFIQVLEKVSELIKMPKSKLELHLSHNRHDTISGIYNLMLDEVLDRETEGNKAITKDWWVVITDLNACSLCTDRETRPEIHACMSFCKALQILFTGIYYCNINGRQSLTAEKYETQNTATCRLFSHFFFVQKESDLWQLAAQ